MIIKIEDKEFESKNITRLYPAAVIKTGDGDEMTQISLEWIETNKRKVEVVGYGLFVNIGKDVKYSFVYDTQEEMEALMCRVVKELQG